MSQFATLLAPLITPDADDLTAGMRIFAEADTVGTFDAVLAAIMMRREHLTALVSADRALRPSPGSAFSTRRMPPC